MQIVPIERIETVRLESPRAGVFYYQRPLQGEVGSLDNFSLELVRTESDFFSPRHRHNFDQIRFHLEGVFDFSRDGKMKPGTLGFFPEGTPYGPQTSGGPSLSMVLQFGGASRSGFMSKEQLDAGVRKLKTMGALNNGIFTWIDEKGRKHNKDSYQAVWEMVFGRKLVYPQRLYQRPVLIDTFLHEWQPVAPGVAERYFGTFSARRTGLSMLRLEPGASTQIDGHAILLVTEGTGRAGSDAFGKWSTLRIGQGERGRLSAESPLEILVMSIPQLAAERARDAA